jgi:hypothetical protein
VSADGQKVNKRNFANFRCERAKKKYIGNLCARQNASFHAVTRFTAHSGTSKAKAIRVTGLGGPQGCETSRLPHFLDNRLTDWSKIFSLTLRRAFTPGRFLVLISVRCCQPQGHSAAGRIRSIEKSNDLIGNRSRDFPVTSMGVPKFVTQFLVFLSPRYG